MDHLGSFVFFTIPAGVLLWFDKTGHSFSGSGDSIARWSIVVLLFFAAIFCGYLSTDISAALLAQPATEQPHSDRQVDIERRVTLSVGVLTVLGALIGLLTALLTLLGSRR
jgi:hypothetical protein